MKTQKIISVKVVTTVMLTVILLAFSSCKGKQGNLAKKKEQSAVSQANAKPPSIDIHTAALTGNLEAIHQHIKAGSDLNTKEPLGGSTPLITATVFGKTDVALALIEAGANLNCKNNEGSTPLHCAAFFCRTEIVKALLEKGADKNLKNNYGSTALESITGSFNDVKGIYDHFSKELGPMGFKLDYAYIEKTRPKIAEMLR